MKEIEWRQWNANQRRKTRTEWVSEYIRKRPARGGQTVLINELRLENSQIYKNFIRLTTEDYEELHHRVTPLIEKHNTNMRESISASQ